MSLVDDIFGSIPGPLIDQWGISVVYIKASENQSYDPESGIVMGVNSEIPAKAIISEITPEEAEGFYQEGMVKFLMAASYLGSYYPRITDSIRYMQGGVSRTAKIVKPMPYRGDGPIMYSIFAKVG